MATDIIIQELAARQHGLVARRQLRARGISSKAIGRRMARGMLIEATPRVLRLAGAPVTLHTRLLTGVLHSNDSILSHTSAAGLWGIAGFRPEPIHVAITRNRRYEGEAPAVVHHATVIPDDHRRVLQDIPIASPALTLFQLASITHPQRLERAVDSAWSLRLVDIPTLVALLDRLARQGRNGIVAMRKILKDRLEMECPPQSNVESRFLQIMRDCGITTLRPQVNLGDGTWTGRVDFVDSELPLVIEIQSERYHTALSDRRRDAERRARLEAQGYLVIEIWDYEIFHHPVDVIDQVMQARLHLLTRS